MRTTRVSPARLYLILLVLTLTPWFFPEIRDLQASIFDRAGGRSLVEHLHEDAAPATVAIIREARGRFREQFEAIFGEPATTVTYIDPKTGEKVTKEIDLGADGQTQEVEVELVPDPDDTSLNTGPSLTAEEVEAVLRDYNSPAAGIGLGEHSVKESLRTGIDNAYWLTMFIRESGAGSNPAWAGNKGNGHYTANTGNIIAIPGYPAYGRFADFNDDWALGTTQHFELLRCYRDGGGAGCEGLWTGKAHSTIEEAIHTWAPAEDANDPASYSRYVVETTREWRLAKLNVAQAVIEAAVETTPSSSCQAELWPNAYEGINWDYGYHEGAYDWVAPLGTEVHTPACGTFVTQGEYWDQLRYGAYFILLTDGGLEIYVGHLDMATINPLGFQPGQRVEAGQLIGQLGEFPYSAPHAHVQLRRDGVLVGPDRWWQEWENR